MLVSVGGSPDQYDNAQVSYHHADEDGEDGDDDIGDDMFDDNDNDIEDSGGDYEKSSTLEVKEAVKLNISGF